MRYENSFSVNFSEVGLNETNKFDKITQLAICKKIQEKIQHEWHTSILNSAAGKVATSEAIYEFVKNAIAAGASNMTLSVETSNNQVCITCENNGKKPVPQHKRGLYSPVQAIATISEKTKREEGGAHLGLAIASDFLLRNDGELILEQKTDNSGNPAGALIELRSSLQPCLDEIEYFGRQAWKIIERALNDGSLKKYVINALVQQNPAFADFTSELKEQLIATELKSIFDRHHYNAQITTVESPTTNTLADDGEPDDNFPLLDLSRCFGTHSASASPLFAAPVSGAQSRAQSFVAPSRSQSVALLQQPEPSPEPRETQTTRNESAAPQSGLQSRSRSITTESTTGIVGRQSSTRKTPQRSRSAINREKVSCAVVNLTIPNTRPTSQATNNIYGLFSQNRSESRVAERLRRAREQASRCATQLFDFSALTPGKNA